jgi:hypothetical protein
MSKQNSKKPALPGSTVTMGLDIGYGVVKAVTADQVVMFPSVMGHAREIKFQQEDMARRHLGDQMRMETGSSAIWRWKLRRRFVWKTWV